MDDAERARIGVVDARLLGREPVLDELVCDALIGERARGVEAERLEIAGQHLHGGDAAAFDRFDELGARREGKIRPAPQAETLRIGEIVDRGGAGRRDIEHARIGKRVLQAKPARPCCDGSCSPRSLLPPPAFCMAWLSSNTITPSKSRPSQSTICCTRDAFASRSAERSVA